MTSKTLHTAIAAYDKAIAKARRDRDTAIRRAHRDGMRQVDIIRATGYSRETIRTILKQSPE